MGPIAQAQELRPHIGVVLQSAGFPTGMKVKDILLSWRHYIPSMTKVDVTNIAKRVHISYLMDRPLSSLSDGESRRIDIAIALFGNPRLIVLDKPTTGLDPFSRENVWDIIRQQRDHGSTVLLIMHYLDEVEALSDTVSVINHGHITATGTVEKLATSVLTHCVSAVTAEPHILDSLATLLPPDSHPNLTHGQLEWQTYDPAHDLAALYHTCFEQHWELSDIRVEKPSLRAAYASLVEAEDSSLTTKDERR